MMRRNTDKSLKDEIMENKQVEPQKAKKDLVKALEKEGAELIDCRNGFSLTMNGGATLQYIGDFKIVLVRNE